jgi:hypothetical protein
VTDEDDGSYVDGGYGGERPSWEGGRMDGAVVGCSDREREENNQLKKCPHIQL